MKYLFATILLVFSTQAFAEGLDDAFKAALANSENDHVKQQVAFQVAPDQVEKATFRRAADPHVVDLPATANTDATVDTSSSTNQPAPASISPANNDDMSAVEEEVDDMD